MSATTSCKRTGELGRTFAACAAEGRAALVIYVTAGHPSPAQTVEVLSALADAGADVLELGVPFSDPLADGPTIQRSSHEAILQGVDLAWVMEVTAQFRSRRDTPVVLFSYLNPILQYGMNAFLSDAVDAGADGVLVTDLPAGCDVEIEQSIRSSPLDLIRLIAPTTPPERVRRIAREGEGFLYYLARTGVTGTRTSVSETLPSEIAALREVTTLPIAVGFGIADAAQAAAVAQAADGVVVGSAVVDALRREGIEGAAALVSALQRATLRQPGPFDTAETLP